MATDNMTSFCQLGRNKPGRPKRRCFGGFDPCNDAILFSLIKRSVVFDHEGNWGLGFINPVRGSSIQSRVEGFVVSNIVLFVQIGFVRSNLMLFIPN